MVADGTELVGTIVAQPTYAENDCAYFTRHGVAAVHQFAVHPEHQGSGIGRMLLQRAEQWARDSGFVELAMDTAEQATHFVELYTRLGYHTSAGFSGRARCIAAWSSANLSSPVPNPSIERTPYGMLRMPTVAVHVKR